MRQVTVLVCGETLRGDDGVGRAIAAALPRSAAQLAEIRHVGSLMPDDLVDVTGPLVLVDAVVGPTPGAIVDIPLAAVAADAGTAPTSRSSHVLSLPAILGISAALGRQLPAGRFIGVAAGKVTIGEGLSPEVAFAVEPAARQLAGWIRRLSGQRGAATCA